MRQRLTERWIRSCRAPATGRAEYVDTACPGLWLRVSGADVKAFSILTGASGRLRRHTIGRHPVWTLKEARREALRILRQAHRLQPLNAASPALATPQAEAPLPPPDPMPAPRPAVIELAAEPSPTYRDLVQSYVELHAKPNARSWRNIERDLLHPRTEPLHPRPAAGIARADLAAVLDGIVGDGHPQAANNVRTRLGMLFRWLHDRDAIPINPAAGLRRPARVVERDRVLSDDELARVWRATVGLPNPYGQLFRCLALTGMRRTECASLRWRSISETEILVERTKSGHPLVVPATALALATIRELPRYGPDAFVFSNNDGRTHVTAYSAAKALLDRLCPLETPFRPHDLRRTYRSGLARLGVRQEVAKKLVGHSEAVVDRIYMRYDLWGERVEAAERWSRHVEGLVA